MKSWVIQKSEKDTMNWDQLGIVMVKEIPSNFGKTIITSTDRVELPTSKPILPTLKEEISATFSEHFLVIYLEDPALEPIRLVFVLPKEMIG